MKNMTRQEFVASLRRKSSGFSRGASIYRGVTRHHQHGRWQARIGRVAGNKDLYLGTFSTQEEAAEAYDIAAIKFRGLNAVTNFDMTRYDVKSIANSSLPIGGLSNKNNKFSTDSLSESKGLEVASISDERNQPTPFTISQQPSSSTLSFAVPIKQDPSSDYWSNILGFHSNNNPSHVVVPSTTPFNMDFSSHATPSSTNSDNNGGFFSGFVQHQQDGNNGSSSSSSSSTSSSSTSSIPFATPIFSLSSTNSYGNNWINNGHAFQTHAKPSLFQTPIFGME
ncbi:hypothetical protein KIW84_040441 [Lathyrus oleraceus]|nr:hypothetical protein KIW84_040441 [Pisum sativum]